MAPSCPRWPCVSRAILPQLACDRTSHWHANRGDDGRLGEPRPRQPRPAIGVRPAPPHRRRHGRTGITTATRASARRRARRQSLHRHRRPRSPAVRGSAHLTPGTRHVRRRLRRHRHRRGGQPHGGLPPRRGGRDRPRCRQPRRRVTPAAGVDRHRRPAGVRRRGRVPAARAAVAAVRHRRHAHRARRAHRRRGGARHVRRPPGHLAGGRRAGRTARAGRRAHPRLPRVLRHPRGPRPTVRAAARRSGGHHARVAHRRPRRRGPGRVRAGRGPEPDRHRHVPRRACAPSPRSSTNARRSSSRTRRSPSWCSPAGRRPTSPGCAGGRRWCRSARSARCCGPDCAWDGCAAPSP